MSKSRQLRTSCLPATLALSSGIVSDASATSLPEVLITALETFDQAQINGDVPKLRSLLADDHLLVNGDGSVEDRDDLPRDYAGGGLRINPLTIVHPLVRSRPAGAIMGGVIRLGGVSEGRRFEPCIGFTDVSARRSAAWAVVMTHASKPGEGNSPSAGSAS